jgi:rSAM/selenodomain-associated transferase 2
LVSVTVVIPVYRDVEALARTLATTDFSGAEFIIVATAGDESLAALRLSRPDISWIDAPRGRARQMNAGAAAAGGDWLLFLHADSRLPPRWRHAIEDAECARVPTIGCFRFALDSTSWAARAIEAGVRLRVWLCHLPYGDQALFIQRDLFEFLGGYRDLPVMEDVDLVRRARAHARLFRSRLPVVTSARRWERDGWVRRTVRHLVLIVLYFCGVPPHRLIRLDPARSAHPAPPGGRMSL